MPPKVAKTYEPFLLTSEELRACVSDRDHEKCVWCGDKAIDVFYILDKELFRGNELHTERSYNGNYIENCVCLCGDCNILYELTDISPKEIRHRANIQNIVVPIHLYGDREYDKWGNLVLNDNTRCRGELFYSQKAQRALRWKMHLFIDLVEYPRTYHLPWSLGAINDDRQMGSIKQFKDRRVIVTRKMDGENVTFYTNNIHSRSINNAIGSDPTKTWIKRHHDTKGYMIPAGWRVCGEDVSYTHSIEYNDLTSFFYGFSVWNDKNECLSWDDTIEFLRLMDVETTEVLYDGIFDEDKIKKLSINLAEEEGYVMRTADQFSYGDFRNMVGKMVRENHVQISSKDWHKNMKRASLISIGG